MFGLEVNVFRVTLENDSDHAVFWAFRFFISKPKRHFHGEKSKKKNPYLLNFFKLLPWQNYFLIRPLCDYTVLYDITAPLWHVQLPMEVELGGLYKVRVGYHGVSLDTDWYTHPDMAPALCLNQVSTVCSIDLFLGLNFSFIFIRNKTYQFVFL